MSAGFFYRRLVRPILDLLKQGVTPEKLALSLALGCRGDYAKPQLSGAGRIGMKSADV